MAASRIAKPKRARPSATTAETQFFAQFRDSPAPLSRERIEAIERALMYQPHGVNRRIALAALAHSGAELVEWATRDRESAVLVGCIAESARDAAVGLREIAGLLDTAGVRAEVALCARADMDSVIAEAKTRYSDDADIGRPSAA